MSGQAPSYIVVEGPIGVGKTSLSRRLAETYNAELMLEAPEENPFLERFYQDPKGAALPTQLFFLMQRVRQLEALRQGDIFKPVRVADFLVEKDRLFAQVTLDDAEHGLYEQVYEQLTLDAPKPDLVIYLQAPVDVLMERVARRGRSFERLIDSTYLHRLSEAYASFFYHYEDAPLLIVNASGIDWVNREEDYRQLLEFMRGVNAGRHYFNPLPFAM
ncbi:deoxynucleoside kinase [Thioalkalivibrio denitrificans]|uniref:Deoxynucleoside kinase n=1 Tax=Thioalkalivibrio denitrificans TaxID=108003 RepID=A0A1V3NF88_9GAMM|nr:deoxynucleoside kinase [Thioalkalivibrio denitrificans]OOG23779.1 deoxynucleoside kinase [Thioalkalivibrio denitrificans]